VIILDSSYISRCCIDSGDWKWLKYLVSSFGFGFGFGFGFRLKDFK